MALYGVWEVDTRCLYGAKLVQFWMTFVFHYIRDPAVFNIRVVNTVIVLKIDWSGEKVILGELRV